MRQDYRWLNSQIVSPEFGEEPNFNGSPATAQLAVLNGGRVTSYDGSFFRGWGLIAGANSLWEADSVWIEAGATIDVEAQGLLRTGFLGIEAGASLYVDGGRVHVGTVSHTTPANAVQVASDGWLHAGGTIHADVISAGKVDVGNRNGIYHDLRIVGDYVQASTAELGISVNSVAPGGHNRLTIDDSATLAGALRLYTHSAAIAEGQMFDAVVFASRVGRFANIAGIQSAGNGLSYAHMWTDDSLRFRVSKTGDANFDGFVDAADYTLWADHYLQTDNTWQFGDFNGDFIVDGADFTLWADNYAPSVFALAVPEPSAWILSLLGAAGVALAAGRRRKPGPDRYGRLSISRMARQSLCYFR